MLLRVLSGFAGGIIGIISTLIVKLLWGDGLHFPLTCKFFAVLSFGGFVGFMFGFVLHKFVGKLVLFFWAIRNRDFIKRQEALVHWGQAFTLHSKEHWGHKKRSRLSPARRALCSTPRPPQPDGDDTKQ